MHQPELERLVGGDDPLAHQEVHRPGDAEVLDEQPVAALVGQQAEAQRGAAEAGRARRDAEVAGEREREAGLDGDAVDRRDRQLVEVARRDVHRLADGSQRVVGADRVVVPGADRTASPRRRVDS